ncbi:Acyl-CoA dehydrogenase, C-terminal domain [Lentzea xinjiangensis]|uniref:Acyl-CoA dehydrogenase, C-terminal domain n=1 Tax=Lentzea xinjiangensis TaxID=402600 RepID=A0A1H9VQL0_9PSEU|nr:acyl-CoA dehydrogenase family protein [Lentzea xinjiangensis]SES23811.1 Acyl-CoA dehydrogenase, C-terminal domain [Lentzea xinjiangensis]
MMFALSPEQTGFASVLHGFLAAGRRDLTALGVDGVTDPADLVVLFEELGHHAVEGPLIESLVVTPALGVAPGSAAFPPAMPHAVQAGRYYLVEGDTVREGTPTAELPSVDPSRRLFPLTGGAVVATGVPATRAFDLGVLTCSAQLLGLGRAMLEMTTSHVLARTQFGRPIGSFQAVKHHLANVLIGLELARPLVFGAAVTMSARDVSAAKVATADAAWTAARTALQVHGAIGYTAEHGLGRFLLQARALRTAWGSPSAHRARVLEAL